MAAPRILLTALLSCTAAAITVVGLASCTPADENPTVMSASGELGGSNDDPDDPGDPTDASDDAVEAAPPAPSSSAAHCSPAGERPGHSVLRVVAADTVDPAELTARATRYVCGPNRFEPAGDPVRYSFAAAGVDAALVDASLVDQQQGDPAKPVPLPALLNHLDDCLASRAPDAPYGCYGNTYDVVLDSHGRIMRITELARP
ncbi:hypothetical protein ACWCXH_22780 [Kitasatospora sp. NPDC001660]